jgi:signal transduction histidine kinase
LDKTILDQREKSIEIASRKEENKYIVEITDNGVGISPENISKIYNAFFSTKPDSGTGLGLSMVQKIISMYNGTIAVRSEVNKGTTFMVTLPLEDV